MEEFYYSGVGAREPDPEAGGIIGSLASELSGLGGILRTGKAKGVDRLFRNSHTGAQEIISDKAVPPAGAFVIAERNHGAWHLCDDRTRAVHAQNVMIHLGPAIDQPVLFSLIWSPAGIEDMGGSALGMRVCREFGIPFFNLRESMGIEAFKKHFLSLQSGRSQRSFP
jgi:hypothetical protein